MVRKEATLLASLILIFVLAATNISATADVAYIYRQSFNVDQNVLRVFNESNLTYDLINERNLPINFAPYKFIYVGDENFRNENRILVNQYPSVIANYYHAHEWGLTDAEGVSQLGGTSPLDVRQNGRLIQVYTQAVEYPSGPSVVYYYLDQENEAPGLQSVAVTEPTASGSDFGDVIAYAQPGSQLKGGVRQQSKMCFFGIVDSRFWTPAAKNLFKDCIGYVAAECQTNSDCGPTEYSDPVCMNGSVYRSVTSKTCQAQNNIPKCVANSTMELVQQCPFDCQNGQCIGQCTRDSDCGTSGPISNFFCSANINVTRTYQIFTCNNPGTANSTCSSVISNRTEETCSDVCVDGSCEDITCRTNADCNDLNSSTEDICHNPGTVQSFCTNERIACFRNNDCGIDGFIGAKMCNGLNVTRTFESFTCNNNGTALSFCSSARETRTVQQCSDACLNGTCQDITCRHDSDCADQNPLTFDQCVNPGTVISECRNTPINCASNSDCGTSGFIGQEFCSNNDVVKTFQNATCNNPGTLQSTCSVTQQNRLVEDCPSLCVNGQCFNPRCSRDSDCNDNNPLTADQCVNPGTVISECRNTPINCASNSDCGITGFVGNTFCSSANDISRNFQTALCVHPGMSNSYCNVTVEQRLQNSCQYACVAGGCARCDSSSDCDDGNSHTIDTCHNPGTAQSYCTNNQTGGGNVTCTVNSDCGLTTNISPPFCSANNVTQLVQSWTCNNGGTQQSYCSSTISNKLVTSCPNYCSDGQCVNIPCFRNSDCDDSRSSTVDLCINPGTPEAYCVHNPIDVTCRQNSDCGTDGYIDSPFCFGNNVTRLFQQFVCNRPGTAQSYCSTSVSDLVVQQCDNGCLNGECTPQQGECRPGEIKPCGSNVGQCREGINVCFSNARWSTQCFGGVSPVSEICNGLDDNCNGQTDEGNVCGGGCSNECTGGEERCDGNGYQTCGNYDSDSCTEWSQTTSCSFGQICQSGSCVTPTPTCSDECTSGLSECSGNGYRMCGNYDSDSCLEWSSVTQCSVGQTCFNGQCRPSCSNECTGGEERCDGNGYKICGNYDSDSCTEWSQTTSCSFGQICQSGSCVTPTPTCSNECSAGQERCSGNGYQTCGNFDSDSCLEWSGITSCSFGQICQSGLCI